MKLTIRPHHLTLSATEHEQLRRCTYAALSRTSPWIRSVEITLTATSAAPIADRVCVMYVRGRGVASFVIEHAGVGALETVTVAAERAGKMILRDVARRRPLRSVPAF